MRSSSSSSRMDDLADGGFDLGSCVDLGDEGFDLASRVNPGDKGFDLGSCIDLGGRDGRRGDDGMYDPDPRWLKASEFFSLELPVLTHISASWEVMSS